MNKLAALEAFQKVLDNLPENALRKLAASPVAIADVMQQVRADVERRQAERAAEQRKIVEGAAIEKAVAWMSEQLQKIQADIDAIKTADRRRKYLDAANKAYWKNGSLHFSQELFEAALAAGGNDDQ